MNYILARVRKWLLTAKQGQWLLLALSGFATPEGVRAPSLISRFANYWTPPLVAAGFFALAFAAFGKSLMSVIPAPEAIDPKQYYEFMSNLEKANVAVGFALSFAFVYGFSVVRWAYHRIWVRIFCKFGLPARPALLRFFILKTSNSTFIFGLFCFCLSLLFPSFARGELTLPKEFLAEHPTLTFFAMLVAGGISEAKRRVDAISDRQMYGPPWAALIKGLVTIGLLLAAMYALPYVFGLR